SLMLVADRREVGNIGEEYSHFLAYRRSRQTLARSDDLANELAWNIERECPDRVAGGRDRTGQRINFLDARRLQVGSLELEVCEADRLASQGRKRSGNEAGNENRGENTGKQENARNHDLLLEQFFAWPGEVDERCGDQE